MRLSRLFIDRPILAGVISVMIMLVGAVAYFALPISQYPEIAPPSITVTAAYPGANAETAAATVAAPLEQEINGVERMLYLSSQSTADGRTTITVTFALGTDLDTAQVLVQNRVNIALPRLPEEVRRLGVVTNKNTPDILMVVHVYSPDNSRDQLYLSNYTLLNIRDRLARLDGVGDLRLIGAREYSMRIWLDPNRISALGLTAGQVVQALRSQNVQVAGGVLDRPPSPHQGAYEVGVQLLGRLTDPAQFGDVLIKGADEGRLVRVRDVGRIELGAVDYSTNAYLDDKPAVAIPIFQRPGSNALATARRVQELMASLRPEFPAGLDYDIVYNPSEFIAESVQEVQKTIFEAADPRGLRRGPLPAIVARVGDSARRHSGVAHRHVRRPPGVWLLAEFALALRARPGDRHRRGRRHRGGGGCGTQSPSGDDAARRCAAHHGRSGRRAGGDRPRAVRGVRADGVHSWNLRSVLPPIRADDCCGYADLVPGVLDTVSRAGRTAPASPQ